MSKRIIGMVSLVVTASVFALASQSVEANPDAQAITSRSGAVEQNGAQRGSCHEIIINATPEAVYKAIIQLREESQDSVKQLSHEANHYVLEETFPGLPFVGEVKCVYKEVYTPFSRIEYSLVRSARFRAFEGRWLLRPIDDGAATRLSLSSYVDVDIAIPFAKQITKVQTSFAVKERLQEVKQTCEKMRVARAKSRSVTQ
ncbi:MAG: hypothetical protein KGS72_21790 [Cyanobacteria bacterium REEB67]|nr:hypothetical protein [Cyanobacteria bacterium REEB67]